MGVRKKMSGGKPITQPTIDSKLYHWYESLFWVGMLSWLFILLFFSQRIATLVVGVSGMSALSFLLRSGELQQTLRERKLANFGLALGIVCIILILSQLSAFWSSNILNDVFHPLKTLAIVAGGILAYLFLAKHKQTPHLIWLFVAYLSTLFAQILTSGQLAWILRAELQAGYHNRIFVTYALLYFPLVGVLVHSNSHKFTRLALLSFASAMIVWLSIYSSSQTTLVAWWCGIITLIISKFGGKRLQTILVSCCVGLPVFVILAIYLGSTHLDWLRTLQHPILESSSAIIRLEIWRFALAAIVENPIRGWGYDAFEHLTRQPFESNLFGLLKIDQQAHPHNAILQIGVELGVIGLAILSALIFALGRAILASGHAKRPYHIALFVAVLAVECVSHGAWQSWWIATLFILLCASLQLERTTSKTDPG